MVMRSVNHKGKRELEKEKQGVRSWNLGPTAGTLRVASACAVIEVGPHRWAKRWNCLRSTENQSIPSSNYRCESLRCASSIAACRTPPSLKSSLTCWVLWPLFSSVCVVCCFMHSPGCCISAAFIQRRDRNYCQTTERLDRLRGFVALMFDW